MAETEHGLEIPQREEHFFLPQDIIDNLGRIEALSQRHPVNVLAAGRQGCGKSTMVRQFAARNHRPLAAFQIGVLSEPGQLFGEHRLKDGETYYQQFLFPQAIQTPGCVIHLEEINRPEHPKALNMLFSVLSQDRQVWTDELGLIKVAPGVVFFATLNEGEEFVGTEMLDAALRDRFYVTLMDYLTPQVETNVLHLKTGISPADAQTIVNVAGQLRKNAQEPVTVSTRHTLMIAEMVAVGATVKEAFAESLQVSRDILESVLLSLHLQTGATEKSNGSRYNAY
ncbi:nitric oxide reductase NorQ protein [Desulfatibacillum alkenivorans DSM 16219]|jgi:nitric oxide reductase NorQ protein|uniref:Nitric oxide reductase NorQ protein n=1 Tax=Desulfatibacillum alkenivorans DSM 16219 TaxID=1121393 RepID=A0A1M6CUX6_9BACT|nr:MoxR family ATPase [Desulfatibacillum alkenivorans]SHI64827.1 nitric oxide reductase NorQ protein [Desulfatibacillum alkenivorans DSM 16219]